MRPDPTAAGQIIIPALVFGSVALLLITGLVSWASLTHVLSRTAVVRERALHVAEVGIEYTRWHLAHAPTDYQDGTGRPGPYTHEVKDKDGNVIGQFVLDITPPAVGSTVVTVRSTGSLTVSPTVRRIIETRLAIPTLARYAVVSNSDVRFGEGTEVFGRIHGNGGIRFDGLAHNLVEGAREAYHDPDHPGNEEFGVHTHVPLVDPLPPAPVPSRADVFEAGRNFPVPAIDFEGLTADLAVIKSAAQANGVYLASSGALGYHLVLRTDDTFDLYRVTRLFTAHRLCSWGMSWDARWGTWSIAEGGEEFVQNTPFPSNGLIFVEDHVWVDGSIDTARLTIASARFPSNPATRTSIIVNGDLRYTNTDGRDVLGLFAQGDITVGLLSEDDLRIDAALLAQYGRVGRPYYRKSGLGNPGCGEYALRSTLTAYGMIVSNERYGFSWSCGNAYCSGYATRNLRYDPNLEYSPPPYFPRTSDQYETLSWEEIR